MGVQTDGAADAKQVYVPAPHEQGVHRAHYASITRACTACPSRPRHWGRRMRGLLMWHHLGANACIRRAYSAPLENTKNVTGPRCAGLGGLRRPAGLMALLSAGQRRSAPVSAGQPWRIQATGGSVSPGGRCWQSHQVPPGQSS